jgi:hypothetical protein
MAIQKIAVTVTGYTATAFGELLLAFREFD